MIGGLCVCGVGDDWGSSLEMIHDSSRFSDHLPQPDIDSSPSSSFVAYETASVSTFDIASEYTRDIVPPLIGVNSRLTVAYSLSPRFSISVFFAPLHLQNLRTRVHDTLTKNSACTRGGYTHTCSCYSNCMKLRIAVAHLASLYWLFSFEIRESDGLRRENITIVILYLHIIMNDFMP